MITVNKIISRVCLENCYIVCNDLKQSIIIDPGSNYEEIIDFVKQKGLNVLGVLLTHGHYDHIFSCKKLQELGYKIYISKFDEIMCSDENLNFAKSCGEVVESFIPDFLISENEEHLTLGAFEIKILHTPGHSKGGLSYIIDNHLFSGDTLFEKGYGRTDLFGGNFREILSSIKLLRKYTSAGYILHSGHDY